MLKLKHRVEKSIVLIANIRQMTKLAWNAAPAIFVALVVLQAAQGFTPVLMAWITKQIFDFLTGAFRAGSSVNLVQQLLPLLVVQAGVNVIVQAFGQVGAYLNAELDRKLHLTTQSLLYRRINSLDGLGYFENPAFHDTVQMAFQGLYGGPSQMLRIFLDSIRSIITLVSFVGILLFLSPVLAVIVAIASVPQLIAQLKIGRQRFGMMYANSPKERKASYLGQILASVHFVKELRLFNLGDYFLDGFLNTTAEVQSTQRAQQLREIKWQMGLGTLSTLTAGICFFIIVLQAVYGNITIGDLTLYMSALGSVQGSLLSLSMAIASLHESALFFTRYNDLMALPPSIFLSASPRPLQPLASHIELQGVSFRYTADQPWVLQNVNLVLPKGKCLGLVGLNGAGKTTLVKLLTRLYDPTEGRILWDGIDIREFDVQQLREHMSVIFQDFVRYDLTVQENIGIGSINHLHNEQRVRSAAETVKVDKFIKDLPHGYQTVLSRWLVEDGAGVDLSGGQWQKIAIARMFMREADFLILDEPTASLDAESEYDIYRHFATLVKGRTSLLISHRFSTLRIADVIAVLENSEITEYGTHQELLVNNKTYARLHSMFSEQYL